MTTAGVLLLLRAGRLDDAFELTVAPIACTAITSLLKVVFHTARPHLFPWILPARGFAYPSGHAATGACLYPLMAVMLWQSGRGTWRKGAAVGLVLVGIGMMWSRMYLGVHWPRDVVGGAAIGGAWCLVALRARRIPAG
jgi:undecaprenyl-diphosphatase